MSHQHFADILLAPHRRHRLAAPLIACALTALLLGACGFGQDTRSGQGPAESVAPSSAAAGTVIEAGDNQAVFAQLLTDLYNAYDSPSPGNRQAIEQDLASIRDKSAADYELAKSISDNWGDVYLDDSYPLYTYDAATDEWGATKLADAGIDDTDTHAFIVLGYELADGQMTRELRSRCNAAAAAAEAYPNSILVCTGGATGANNPSQHTEAGLMRDYLVDKGIDKSRIEVDEKALSTIDNATNTLEILRGKGIKSATIVTSTYHQRWSQAVFNAVKTLYARENDYDVDLVANYCCEVKPSQSIYAYDALLAVRQIAAALELSSTYADELPPTPALPEEEAAAAERADPKDVGKLLADLLSAYHMPGDAANQAVEADLAAIEEQSEMDYALAQSIADTWYEVYLDPYYPLYLYYGEGQATALEQAGMTDSESHAFVVMGYELQNGEMADELCQRCEAAAAAARSFPSSLIICTGGSTGKNNPNKHTEAGLMRDYLVNVCGIDKERILVDEQAINTDDNALNSLALLRQNGISSMTIVTSSYHQRWVQTVFSAAAAVFAQRTGYDVDIVYNYNFNTYAPADVLGYDDQAAIDQIADVLELPEEARTLLPNLPEEELPEALQDEAA